MSRSEACCVRWRTALLSLVTATCLNGCTALPPLAGAVTDQLDADLQKSIAVVKQLCRDQGGFERLDPDFVATGRHYGIIELTDEKPVPESEAALKARVAAGALRVDNTRPFLLPGAGSVESAHHPDGREDFGQTILPIGGTPGFYRTDEAPMSSPSCALARHEQERLDRNFSTAGGNCLFTEFVGVPEEYRLPELIVVRTFYRLRRQPAKAWEEVLIRTSRWEPLGRYTTFNTTEATSYLDLRPGCDRLVPENPHFKPESLITRMARTDPSP